jgi:ferredoxin
MPNINIDGIPYSFEQGETILQIAQRVGINIPSLCFMKEYQPSTSCMVCIVKVRDRVVPSCATIAEDGMIVESETPEMHEARQTALELLLSDHIGDCIAPCHNICPAEMNIPLMIRQIISNDLQGAIITIKKDIPIPAILGRICPAPCEKGCRRGDYDNAITICLLKRYVADVDLLTESPYYPICSTPNGKKIAIIGGGPAGLSSAYYLMQKGYACTIFDDHEKLGGTLRYAIPEDRLPKYVVDAEVETIKMLGLEFRPNTKVGVDISIESLQKEYDAVIIAIWQTDNPFFKDLSIDRKTLQANIKGLFVAGNATGRRGNMAVRSVQDGKIAASSVDQYLSGSPVIGIRKVWTTRIGKLSETEMQILAKNVSQDQRIEPSGIGEGTVRLCPEDKIGFSETDAIKESLRCFHCDCRKGDNCKLRVYSDICGANHNKYRGERRRFEQQTQHENVIYESGKCISCELCIKIALSASELLGLTFIGRGFNVKVGVPFNRTIKEGLQKVAEACVTACPTGAIAIK